MQLNYCTFELASLFLHWFIGRPRISKRKCLEHVCPCLPVRFSFCLISGLERKRKRKLVRQTETQETQTKTLFKNDKLLLSPGEKNT